MLIDKENLVRYKGEIKIPTLQGLIDGYGEIAMAKKEGVVFISYFKKDAAYTLEKFIVGAMNERGELIAQKEFTENNEKTFFDAVNYFEELISQRQQPEEKNEISVGKFYFFKKSLKKESFVSIPGTKEIVIEEKDIDAVFSPPVTKLYGRLNLAEIYNPNYFPIQGKYALKYLDKETQEYGQNNNLDTKDFAIYDMIPYQIGNESSQEESNEEPDDVNLNPADIENEDLQPKKEQGKEEKEQDKKDQQAQQKGKQKGQEGEQGEDGEGEQGEDGEGEQGEDGEGEQQSQQGEQGEKRDSNQEGRNKEDAKEAKAGKKADKSKSGIKAEEDEKEKQRGEEQKQQQDSKTKKSKDDKKDDQSQDEEKSDKAQQDSEKTNQELVQDLQSFFGSSSSLKSAFKKQSNMVNLLKTYTLDEIKSSELGKYVTGNKEQLIELVKQQTKNNF